MYNAIIARGGGPSRKSEIDGCAQTASVSRICAYILITNCNNNNNNDNYDETLPLYKVSYNRDNNNYLYILFPSGQNACKTII